MGLDQYAYATDAEGNKETFHEWRKHPAIHYWMESLWESKGRPNFDEETMGGHLGDFNCAPVPLTKEDVLKLKEAVEDKTLNYNASGFFFGESAPPGHAFFDEEQADDLAFISKALEHLKTGKTVHYNSWW